MFSQEIADVICAKLAEGGSSLRKACAPAGFPAPSTFLMWVNDRPELAEQYARARATGNDVEFDGLVDLADEPPEVDDKGKIDPAWVAWQRTRIDVRKWSLSKKEPKKYGDKIENTIQGPDGKAVRIIASSHDEAL